MRKYLPFVIVGWLLTLPLVSALAEARIGNLLERKLNLREKEIPVIVIFKEQAPVEEIRKRTGKFNRVRLKDFLKDTHRIKQNFVRSLCKEMKAKQRLQRSKSYWLINAMSVKADAGAILEIAAQREIKHVILDVPRLLVDPTEAPESLSESIPEDWGIERIKAYQVHQQGVLGEGVEIAVLDSGVAPHPEFEERLLLAKGKSFVASEEDAIDLNGHGTHCAGTIAGKTLGVAPRAKIIPIKVLGANGFGTMSGILDGVEHAITQEADVLNMSLGGPATESINPLETAIDQAMEAGVICVVAAGNSGPSEQTINTPGTFARAITVGSINIDNEIAQTSSRGPTKRGDNKPDLCAPGVNITSASHDGPGFHSRSGTSMATPHVAGVVALLLSHKDDLSHDQIKKLLLQSAVGPKQENVYGKGRVDALKALALLKKNEKKQQQLSPREDLLTEEAAREAFIQLTQEILGTKTSVKIFNVSLQKAIFSAAIRTLVTPPRPPARYLVAEMVLEGETWKLTPATRQELENLKPAQNFNKGIFSRSGR